jgi:hypothetical protein
MRTRPVEITVYTIPYTRKNVLRSSLKVIRMNESWVVMDNGCVIGHDFHVHNEVQYQDFFADITKALIHAMKYANKQEDLEKNGYAITSLGDDDDYMAMVNALKSGFQDDNS